MRKNIKNSIYISLAASLLASCSASGDSPVTLAYGSHAVKLGMNVGVSAGIASRELNTWEGAQQVNDMRIYVFRCPKDKKGTPEEAYTYYIPNDLKAEGKSYYTVDKFNNREPYYSANHQNIPEQHFYAIEPYLQNDYYYQFLAVGRDDKYTDTPKILDETNFLEETTKLEEAKISLTKATINSAQLGILYTTELFTGYLQDEKTQADAPVLVTEETKYFQRTITATRNVAGMMIYVKNIPAKVESNAAGDMSTITFMPTSLSIVATGINTETLLKSKQAPAEATPMEYRNLGTIDLTPANGWTVDEPQNIFKRDEDTQKGWKANSYMLSNFMMPTPEESMKPSKNSEEAETTFYLHYTDGTHHRYDNIKIATNTGKMRKFPILANHLYCLGAKSKTVNQPYDLKEYYEPVMTDVKIEIEPAFEKRHEFETE